MPELPRITVSPDEVLTVVEEMYPRELDRAKAELAIRKQAEIIAELQRQLADKTEAESRHGHSHE